MRESGLRKAALKRKGDPEDGVGTHTTSSSISVSNNSGQNPSVVLWRWDRRAAEETTEELKLIGLCLSSGESLPSMCKAQHYINRHDPRLQFHHSGGKSGETWNLGVILCYIASSEPA